MSAQQPDAPEVVVKNLIRDEWDDTLTLGIEPSIHMGWLESEIGGDEGDALFEVTVGNPDENPVDGGDTGYSGFNPVTGKPTQNIVGVVPVNCWSQRGRVGVNGNGASVNPRQFAYSMMEEVKRILGDHYDATDAQGNPTDLARLSYMGAIRKVEPEEEPIMYRYRVSAGYGYHND